MPPKKAPQKESKKTDMKKKEKIIEDKTFGLKNKKGAKQQKFINHVEKQVKEGNQKQSAKQKEDDKKKGALEELDLLIKPVQKVSKGADPKSVLCVFFKQGSCTKGDKCKFSHDVTVERKSEKRSIYSDERNGTAKEDNMDDWDDEKLQSVVNQKHGTNNLTKTDIVCKHFLEAVEISLEELIENERQALSSKAKLTPVTLDSFLKWKKRKIETRKKELDKENRRKKDEFSKGKTMGVTGRQMFTFKPEMAGEDDEEATDGAFEREPDEDEGVNSAELTLEKLANIAREADGSGSKAPELRLAPEGQPALGPGGEAASHRLHDESGKLDQAAALPSDATDQAIAMAQAAILEGVDEDLFDEELDDPDLETLDLGD